MILMVDKTQLNQGRCMSCNSGYKIVRRLKKILVLPWATPETIVSHPTQLYQAGERMSVQ